MIYVGTKLKISRKENKASERFTNFHQFRKLALHRESTESAEGRFSYLYDFFFLNNGYDHG